MDRLVTVLLAAGLGSAALALLRRQGRRTKKTRVALVDNGSLKPEATKSLRRLAAALSERSKLQVDAVSARFAAPWPEPALQVKCKDRIKAKDLDGKKGEVLEGWFKRILEEDPQTEVRLLPLLIGPSDTLTKAMPESAKKVSALQVEIAPPLVSLCPALFGGQESGALQLAEMLRLRLKEIDLGPEDTVLLCDHGSPVQRVANAKMAVREALATAIGREVLSCCMERREGEDFNGELLQTVLLALPHGAIAKVALLFLQEGRHAGPGGDIEQIVVGAMEKRPDLSIRTTSVLAGHSLLEDLLLKRLEQSIPLRVFH